ncbi:UNVERIFIED_CONTAM: hypothetical protein FKN15_051177 [Acipenser sinensis]
MSSLMHTIYEVVDASVNQSSNNSKTLRVKLTVTPEPCSKKKDVPLAGQDREGSRCRNETEHLEDGRNGDKRLSAHISLPCPLENQACFPASQPSHTSFYSTKATL